MKYESIYAGQTLYNVVRRKLGNTALVTIVVEEVKIISMNSVEETVQAKVNGNPARTFHAVGYSKWRKSKPLLIAVGFGQHRLANREEIAAAKVSVE